MRRRTVAIGIVAIVALLAGTIYAGRGMFLRAQFGSPSSLGFPVFVLQEFCAKPLTEPYGMREGTVDGPGCKTPGYDYCWPRNDFCTSENKCVGKYEARDLPECGTGNPGAMAYVSMPPVSLGGLCHQMHCCSEGKYYGTTDDASPGGSGNGEPAFVLPCADPDASCVPTMQNFDHGNVTFRCCNEHDPSDLTKCIRASSSSSSSVHSCGDGVVNTGEQCDDGNTRDDDACTNSCKNAKCGDGIKQAGVEECDAGTNNVPSATANKSWIDITSADATVLARSSCLDSCKIAQCSDKKDNDKKNGTDGNDAACRDGAFGNGSKILAGYNVEQCPMCQVDEKKDETVAFNPPSNSLLAATVRQHEVAVGDVENLDQQYCRGSYKTISGTTCDCSVASEVCFAEHEVNTDGTIVALGNCECKPLNPPPDMQTWTWACKRDKDCSQGYRCAYYSTYKYLEGAGGNDVDIYRCKKLVDDGEEGCRSRWDCKSRYTDITQVNAQGVLERDDSARTKCLEINQGTPKCCNPDATDPSESCIRPNFSGNAQQQIPQFAACPTGGGAGDSAGGDGGWDSGDGSGGGSGGGDNRGGNGGGGASSSSSSAQCNIYNPCIALTNSPTPGTYAYTMPAACPLTGNKRTCYARCIADINATGVFQNCDLQCSASESDLNMCACNEGFSDCAISCGDGLVQCSNLCTYDSNQTTCRTECRSEYRSCLNSCGRMCPASTGSSSRQSRSSISTNSKGSEGSSKSGTSASSRSSASSQNNSLGSNGSNGSNTSQESLSSNTSQRSSVSNNSSQVSNSSKTSVSSTSQTSSNHSGSSSNSSITSNQSSKSSNVSSSFSKSSGSYSSVTCVDEGTVPQMRVLFSKVESTNPNVTLEQRVYIDGIHPQMVGGQAKTIAAGTWFPISSIDTQDFASIYDGPNIVRNDSGDPTVTSINFSISPASWVRGGIEKGTDNTYDSWYGTIEFQGVTIQDADCSRYGYSWWCPEKEHDGVILAPDNDEVWVEGGVVHFALHTKNVSNTDGRTDRFTMYYKLLPICPASSSTSRSSRMSSSSTSQTSSNHSGSSSNKSASSSLSSSRSSSSSSSRSSSSRSSSSFSSSSRSSSSFSSSSSSSGGGTNGGIGGITTGISGATGGINGGTTGGAIGGTVTGIGGGVSGTTGYTSSTGTCSVDQDCPLGTRCILSRCLTVTDIAQLPSFCGNARLDAGEVCDNGADNSNKPNAYCRPDCTLGRCGDGIIDTPLEQCDDGNSTNNDGCSSICQLERGAPSTLPATTIELPFTTNKGDLGSNTGGQGVTSGSGGNGSDQNNLPSSVPSTPDTGPAALAVMIAGGAAGWLYRRRK